MNKIQQEYEVKKALHGRVKALFDSYGPQGLNLLAQNKIVDNAETRRKVAELFVQHPLLTEMDHYFVRSLLGVYFYLQGDFMKVRKGYNNLICYVIYKKIRSPLIRIFVKAWPVYSGEVLGNITRIDRDLPDPEEFE